MAVVGCCVAQPAVIAAHKAKKIRWRCRIACARGASRAALLQLYEWLPACLTWPNAKFTGAGAEGAGHLGGPCRRHGTLRRPRATQC